MISPVCWTVLKIVGLIGCLVVVQFLELYGGTVANMECAKYQPLYAVRGINSFVRQLWAASVAANAIILLLFLSSFLLRPRSLLSGSVLPVLVSFAVWKGLSLTKYVQYFSHCGYAKDFVYPARLTWLNADFLFWSTVAASLATVAAAVAAIVREDKKRRLRPAQS